MAVSLGQAVLGVTMSEVVEIKPKIKSVAFYIAGPEHHERPRLAHKNETSVAGKVWAYPGPVLTAGKVTISSAGFIYQRFHFRGTCRSLLSRGYVLPYSGLGVEFGDGALACRETLRAGGAAVPAEEHWGKSG